MICPRFLVLEKISIIVESDETKLGSVYTYCVVSAWKSIWTVNHGRRRESGGVTIP